MQRLFSMFPQGGPGVALFLLRLSVAAMFLMNLEINHWIFSGVIRVFIIGVISVLLILGFLTPLASILVCVTAAGNLLIGFGSEHYVYLFAIVNAAALALLGPGAYSVDARLFGRRVTVVSSLKETKRP
jgi:uncharacterized membrane protein YphA (DoxX/SURF4 family)